jgi:hypothetical protein
MNDSLYINDTKIDLKQGAPFPLNFSIADAKEPQSRKRNFSKEISIPGTQANLKFFSSTYQLNITSLNGLALQGFTFDPTLRAKARYYKDGNLVFNGMFQLKEVVLSNGNYQFKGQLYTEIVDLYQSLKDINVSELAGWEVYDHELNITNVSNSWDTSVIVSGVATSNFTAGQPDGFGYLYGLAEYGYNRTNPTYFALNQIAPLLYVRETFLKCLDFLGITYQSNFIDSQRFKSLVWGFGGGRPFELTAGEISARQAKAVGTSATATVNAPASNLNTASLFVDLLQYTFSGGAGATITDTNGQFVRPNDDTQASVVIGATGNYRINFKMFGEITYSTDGSILLSQTTQFIYRIFVNGVAVATDILNGDFANVNFNYTNNITVNAGDVVTVELQVNLLYGVSGATYFGAQLGYDNLTQVYDFDMTSIDTELIEGSTVQMSRFIPQMKASEFLSGIIKMFNLYISDPNELGIVTIEPFADHYEGIDSFDDWSLMVDYSKDVVIKPTSTIEGRTYIFKYAEDGDYYNKLYQDDWKNGYGNRSLDVPSPFQVGEKVYELPFSMGIPTDAISGLVVPTIISIDPATTNVIPYKGKPKIYQYNGLKTGNWRLTNVLVPATFVDYTDYPSLHHFDDWENPTFDLCFLLPQELYYTTTDITNTNIYSVYLEAFIRDLVSRESKIVELNVKLSSNNITQLRFERFKMINGTLFRLNEVRDWDSSINESTKVELLKLVQ